MAPPETGPVLLSWRTLESYPHERSARWYSIGGVLVLAFAAYGLFDRSWSTALVALGIGGIYFLLRNRPPRSLPVLITGLGIRVGGAFTPWNLLKNFWIVVGQEAIELRLSPTRLLEQEILVFLRNPPFPAGTDPAEDIDPTTVRALLLQFLKEREGMEERTLDALARALKL